MVLYLPTNRFIDFTFYRYTESSQKDIITFLVKHQNSETYAYLYYRNDIVFPLLAEELEIVDD